MSIKGSIRKELGLRRIAKAVAAGYRRAAEDLERLGLSGPGRHDVKGELRRARVDEALSRLSTRRGVATDQMIHKGGKHYLEITTHSLVITTKQLQFSNEPLPPAGYRKCNEERFPLFPGFGLDFGIEAAPRDERAYVVLGYGQGKSQNQSEPGFIVFRAPKGPMILSLCKELRRVLQSERKFSAPAAELTNPVAGLKRKRVRKSSRG